MRPPILKNTYNIEKVIIKYKTNNGSVTLVSKLPVNFIKSDFLRKSRIGRHEKSIFLSSRENISLSELIQGNIV